MFRKKSKSKLEKLCSATLPRSLSLLQLRYTIVRLEAQVMHPRAVVLGAKLSTSDANLAPKIRESR